ncbi:hypothetical protein JMUB6875_17360 [Nocardia sp. JMUB6875]
MPENAAILLVPKAVCGARPGSTTNRVGNTISPPPPTTASTHPAAVAAVSKTAQSARLTDRPNQSRLHKIKPEIAPRVAHDGDRGIGP